MSRIIVVLAAGAFLAACRGNSKFLWFDTAAETLEHGAAPSIVVRGGGKLWARHLRKSNIPALIRAQHQTQRKAKRA